MSLLSIIAHFLPIIGFLVYAQIYELTYGALITAAIVAICAIAYLVTRSVILDRLLLGVNLFFFIGVTAIICNIEPILHMYKTYLSAMFFMSIALIGIITTFFSSVGFIGVYFNPNNVRNINKLKDALKVASYKLLAGTFACLVLSLMLSNYTSYGKVLAAYGFAFLYFLRNLLQKQLYLS